MTSSMLCMYEMEIYGRNEYYIGYFCCTLYLVLLCWSHWSRRSAKMGSSLLVSGSHLSFFSLNFSDSCIERSIYSLQWYWIFIKTWFSHTFYIKSKLSHIWQLRFYISKFWFPFKNYYQVCPPPLPTLFNAKAAFFFFRSSVRKVSLKCSPGI